MHRLDGRFSSHRIAGIAGYLALLLLGWRLPAVWSFAGGYPAVAWTLFMLVLVSIPMEWPPVNATGLCLVFVLHVIRTLVPGSEWFSNSWIVQLAGLTGIIMMIWAKPDRGTRNESKADRPHSDAA